MASYLEFFRFEREPFTQPAERPVVLGTPVLAQARKQIEEGLAQDVLRLCVAAGEGLGKTSLARALPRLLRDTARVAVVSGQTDWAKACLRIEQQLGVPAMAPRAMATMRKDKRLVIVIDDAELLSEVALEGLDRWLAIDDGGGRPLLQCVLLADLDAATRSEADTPLLWWLDTLQTLQLELAPIPEAAVPAYIAKHLRKAGWRGETDDTLFDDDAARLIHDHCGGNPRRIGDLCRMLLTIAGEYGMARVDRRLVEEAVGRKNAPPSISPAAVARAEGAAAQRRRRRTFASIGATAAAALGLALLFLLFWPASEPSATAERSARRTPQGSQVVRPVARPAQPVRVGQPRTNTPTVLHVRRADGTKPNRLIVPGEEPATAEDETVARSR